MIRFARSLSLAVALLSAPAAAQTADEIVDRALETNANGFQTGEVTMTLSITDGRGATRERTLHIRGMSEQDQARTVVRVVAPADQAGQAYLFRENDAGEDDVYVFMPALDDAPRRISGSSKNASFMGTHFTFADLESRDISGAHYTRSADEEIGGFAAFVVDAVPAAGASSEYARIRMWVRQSDYIPLRTQFFDDGDQLLKTLFTEETAEDAGRVYIRRLTLRAADGGATTMALSAVDFDAAVAPAEFTPQALAN